MGLKSDQSDNKGLFESFSAQYSHFIPEAHRQFYSPVDLEVFMKARFGFFNTKPGEITLNIYNPGTELFWLVNSTVIEVLMPDSPFIVDTLLDYLNSRERRINLLIHPVFETSRDEKGNLLSIAPAGSNSKSLESYVYLEIARATPGEINTISKDILKNLKELRTIVVDYKETNGKLIDYKSEPEFVAEQIEWLEKNFVILGSSILSTNELKPPYKGLLKQTSLRKLLNSELGKIKNKVQIDLIQYVETKITTTVNKRRPLYLLVLNSNKKLLIAGHFAHRSQKLIRDDIPALKHKLTAIANDLHASPSSHMRKELFKAAQLLPVEVLFTRNSETLKEMFSQIIFGVYQDEVEFSYHMDNIYNQLWIQGIIPMRDAGQIPGKQFSEYFINNNIDIHHHIRQQVNRNEIVFISCSSQNITPNKIRTYLEDNEDLFFSSWSSKFRRVVSQRHVGDKNTNEVMTRYFSGITPDHEIHQYPEETLYDLERLERLKPEDGYKVHYHSRKTGQDAIKIHSTGLAPLSDMIPVLTSFGLVILSEKTFVYTYNTKELYTFSFAIQGMGIKENDDKTRIARAIEAVLNKKTPSDPGNALVITAGLDKKELVLIKALVGYYYQITKSHSRYSLHNILIKYSDFSRSLINLFHARFDEDAKNGELTDTYNKVMKSFRDLESAYDETICKTFLSIVSAIIRTNYYVSSGEVAFKIQCAKLGHLLPKPVPLYEIYVYGYDIEGIHLRGGAVARGGLRWSDRTDDFRTEVLGLMKAQMVKNTLIVPVGSKGGFVIKNRTFRDRAEFQEAGVDTYRRYISALLDLTDNISSRGKVIPARNIKRHDGDDPYLVVAADKGTATFSDIANEISESRNFWLMDAFASGGRNGYDHKVQGITARGAWESVRRHFHEMGQNPEKDNITGVAIGDMAGDVFGNGMLLSRSMKLVAAFNHKHIFLDPDPDPEKSFKERTRLFKQVQGWDSYKPNLISKGGGVFERAARAIALTEPVRTVLGIDETSLSGEELIQAILRAPVDLLWNGGIGTYIKASHESHFEAGDHSNDRVRVNASELRTRVIGEGGNLGLTQAARMEAALNGVRLNTDAIDNSAGVDMSDHEVNLKILLNGLLKKKKIKDLAERNAIIRKYEDEEIRLVLSHNIENNLALSLDTLRTPEQFTHFRSLIKFLNREGLLNRENDSIPFEVDLDIIEGTTRTLSRPLLSSLMGFSKLYLSQTFLESTDFKDPWYDRFALGYFPREVAKIYEAEIKSHQLKREIIITEVVNKIVNNAGIVFFHRMVQRSGESLMKIADAYIRCVEFINAEKLRGLIGRELPSELLYNYLIELEERIFRIILRVIEDNTILKKLNEKNTGQFESILEASSEQSHFRIPRPLKGFYRSLGKENAARVLKGFQVIDVLEDTFNIYIQNQGKQYVWDVNVYFHVMEKYKIPELRKIVRGIKTDSHWELQFLSKIESAIEDLTGKIIRLSDQKKRKSLVEVRKNLTNIIDDIISANERGDLHTSAFYEMILYMNTIL